MFQQRKLPEAIGHLEEGLRLMPEHANARNNLATALFQQGKVAEAIGHYEQVLRLKPENIALRLSPSHAFDLRATLTDFTPPRDTGRTHNTQENATAKHARGSHNATV